MNDRLFVFIFPPGIKDALGSSEFFAECLLIGEGESILRSHNFVRQTIQCVSSDCFVFRCAEDEPNRRIFIGSHPILASEIQIQVHLSRISVSKFSNFEIDDHETPQSAMEKEEIDSKPLVSDSELSLASDERKVISEFKEKFLEILDEGFLKIVF